MHNEPLISIGLDQSDVVVATRAGPFNDSMLDVVTEHDDFLLSAKTGLRSLESDSSVLLYVITNVMIMHVTVVYVSMGNEAWHSL